jgi:hypothetical protein
MAEHFDPKKIIDFNKDYYTILGLDKDILPKGKSRQDKIDLSKLLEDAFRKKARKCHPDFGGSKEEFLDIVRARRIIEDPILKRIFDQGHFDEFLVGDENSDFEVDWSKVGTYRKGTPEDTVGYSLFMSLCNIKNELDIVPAFIPDSNEHNYEWDFIIKNHKLGEKQIKLVISIVNDESEVLRLTSGDNLKTSLPFKIFVCVPKVGIKFIRDVNNQVLSPTGKILANANIVGVAYNDHHFLESTSLEEAKNYLFSEHFKADLADFKNNGSNQNNVDETKLQKQWMDKDQMKQFDSEQLRSILNLRSFETTDDESAGDFIDKIKVKESKNNVYDHPELPL